MFFIVTKHFFGLQQETDSFEKILCVFFCPKKKPTPLHKNGQAGQTCTAEKSSLFAQDDKQKSTQLPGFLQYSAGVRLGFCDFLLHGPEIEGVKSNHFFLWGIRRQLI